jgi:hypothetical protein
MTFTVPAVVEILSVRARIGMNRNIPGFSRSGRDAQRLAEPASPAFADLLGRLLSRVAMSVTSLTPTGFSGDGGR